MSGSWYWCQNFGSVLITFTAMRWLLILAIVLPLATEPAEPPKDKGATEANRAENAGHTKPTKENEQKSIKAVPVSTQSPVAVEGKGASPATANVTSTNSTQTPGEDLRIQRKLAWFTGALVVVGILQTSVMFLTWLIYRRQANEMRRQRHEMKRHRSYMRLQWKAMREQVIETGSQTETLVKSVTVAEENAKSAQANAEAARMSVEALIDKERARIIVEPGKLTIAPSGDEFPIDETKYRVYCLGTTPAFIENAEAKLAATASPDPPGHTAMPPISLKPFWAPNAEGNQYNAILLGSTTPNLDDVNSRRVFIHFWGVITYKDVFGRRRETRFRYRWRVSDKLNNLDGTPFCYWEKCGPETDNSET
jgi:hypothetical protein